MYEPLNIFKIITFTLFILLSSLLFTGCFSYIEISKEELSHRSVQRKTKIILDTSEEIILEPKSAIPSKDDIFYYSKDSTRVVIPYNRITKVFEQRFDTGSTLFSIFWTVLGTIVLVWIIYKPKAG